MKKYLGTVLGRVFAIIFTILLQFGLVVAIAVIADDYSGYFYGFLTFLSVLCAVFILTRDAKYEQKILWIILFLAMPLLGGLIYFTFSGYALNNKKMQFHRNISEEYAQAMETVPSYISELEKVDPQRAKQAKYLEKTAKSPLFKNTQTQYFELGEEMLASMLVELEKAEKFIFMEYFIIEQGEMWNPIVEILGRKASEGVDVRIMYDDLGCILTLPANYPKILQQKGIKCRVFNKFTHMFNSSFNHRDHRKICVIDGNVGFTGGINLADEYINATVKHGHWKDTAVMLKGDAVYSLTLMFLSLWDAITGEDDRYSDFMPTKSYETDGFVQPFYDEPLDDDQVGECLYMSILNQAENYVYITSPYLIISSEMLTALVIAAKSGTDVRLLLPGIPDKKFVHHLAKSYYETLVKSGVRIYEYTPGFVHSKMFISDDTTAVVGTINLDYRSLALHYECGAWFHGSSIVKEIKEDFLETLKVCREITVENYERKGRFGSVKLFILAILRLVSPLL